MPGGGPRSLFAFTFALSIAAGCGAAPEEASNRSNVDIHDPSINSPMEPRSPAPQRASLRPLSREEYNNTVRDLMDDHTHRADSFATDTLPVDDSAYDVDTIADLSSISPFALEKIETETRQMIERALIPRAAGVVPTRLLVEAEHASTSTGAAYESIGWSLPANGRVSAAIEITTDGYYELSARVFSQQSGDEPVPMRWRVDGAIVADVDVAATVALPAIHRHRLLLSAGPHTFSIELTNELSDPQNSDSTQRVRRLVVDWFAVEGPVAADTGPRGKIVSCSRATAACARMILTDFGRRVWRRPLTVHEIDRLQELATSGWQQGESFDVGLAKALQALLLSPHFFYRGEQANSDFELATWLSYCVWRSTPDNTLLDVAANGSLATEVVLQAQLARMAADPRAKDGAASRCVISVR